MGRLTFTLKPLPVCSDWPLSQETLIWFDCCKLCLLCPSALFPPKEGEPPEGSLGSCGALCHLCLFDLGYPTVSGHSVDQLCGSYHHSISVPHWWLPPSLISTPQHHRPQLESWDALFFPMVTLALWPSFSSLPQCQWWHGNLPAWFFSKLLSVQVSWPSWMGLLSKTQCYLPCDREVPCSWSV